MADLEHDDKTCGHTPEEHATAALGLRGVEMMERLLGGVLNGRIGVVVVPSKKLGRDVAVVLRDRGAAPLKGGEVGVALEPLAILITDPDFVQDDLDLAAILDEQDRDKAEVLAGKALAARLHGTDLRTN